MTDMSKMILIDEGTVKLALETLELFITPNWAGAGVDKANEAHAALREALTSVPDWASEAKEQPAQRDDWKDHLIAQHEETILWQAKRIAELMEQPAHEQHFDHKAAANAALRDAQNRSYQVAKSTQPAPATELREQEPVAWIEHNDETSEPCPSCGKPLQSASGGGVVCSGRCGYWFCF